MPDDNINWVWTEADPDHWNIYQSLDSGATYSYYNAALGAIRSIDLVGDNGWFYVDGRDAANVQIIPPGNTVIVP